MRAELEESIPRPTNLGVSPFEVGAVVTGTLLGSVAATLAEGLLGHRLSRKRILLGAVALTSPTGPPVRPSPRRRYARSDADENQARSARVVRPRASHDESLAGTHYVLVRQSALHTLNVTAGSIVNTARVSRDSISSSTGRSRVPLLMVTPSSFESKCSSNGSQRGAKDVDDDPRGGARPAELRC